MSDPHFLWYEERLQALPAPPDALVFVLDIEDVSKRTDKADDKERLDNVLGMLLLYARHVIILTDPEQTVLAYDNEEHTMRQSHMFRAHGVAERGIEALKCTGFIGERLV